MSHEVVKVVGGRRYRYLVESYRDKESGKVRGRWTYLGRDAAGAESDGGTATPIRKRNPSMTRRRLLDALARLLERQGYESVTTDAISTEAGLAHGTFYRHFADKDTALVAVFEDLRAAIARSRPTFGRPLGNLEAERDRVRRWVSTLFEAAIERPGAIRAFYAYGARDAGLRAEKLERRLAARDAMVSYFIDLTDAGLAAIPHPDELAAALLAIIDGALHVAAVEHRAFDATTIAGATEVFDRAIFNRPVEVASTHAAGAALNANRA